MNTKKIGVLGSGVVGQVLATGFLKHGYEVLMGTSNADKLKDWKSKNNFMAKVLSFEEVAKDADIIVLAVKGNAAESVLKLAGINNLTDKTIIDCTNPIDEKHPPMNGVLHYFTNINNSLMEQFQQAVPKANFVKAFNSVGSAYMVNPNFSGITPTMFICGNSDEAKKQVKHILDQFGWETEDMGKVEAARAIEPLCMLWCIQGILHHKWSHAFKLLKK
jgi:predicted dinucleotide-binding enzyme